MLLVNSRRLALASVCALWLVTCADRPAPFGTDDATDPSVPTDTSRRGADRDTGQPSPDLADQGAELGDLAAPDSTVDVIDLGEEPTQDVAGSEDLGDDTPIENPDTGPEIVDASADVAEEDAVCAEVTAVAEETSVPADIIWIIDSSESMNDEIDEVRSNINAFASTIGASGIDFRVILIASPRDIRRIFFPSYWGVCVPPPLSAADRCPDVDNPGVYLHVREDVYSTDSLEILIDSYSDYRSFLRPSAKLHIVEVSDDESYRGTSWFWREVGELPPPGFGDDFTFHSLVQTPGDTCGDGDGDTYISLSETTGGVVASLCDEDWEPIFDVLQEEVIEGSALPCHYAPPDVGEFQVVDLTEVNVYYTPTGGERTVLFYVDDADACGDALAWYYDNPSAPTGINLCPAVCGSGIDGEIEVAFGCDTIKH